MIFPKNKSAVMIFPIVFFSLVFTGCQKTQEIGSNELSEEVGDYEDMLPAEIQQLAGQGDAEAQSKLGALYYLGDEIEKDYSKAFYWVKKSADQGYVDGQMSTGGFYYVGKGVRQDYTEAAKWYKKAASQNDDRAQFVLGIMYEEGEGVRQNKTTAKEWYGKSCDNGNQSGCDDYKILNEQGY